MRYPLVSVVIPLYNSERTIGSTLSAVLTQDYPALEVVVVDDGSTDRGDVIARAYGDRIRLISTPNRGVSAARNTGIEAARGELIALVDADDIILPTYIERAVRTWSEAGGGRRLLAAEAMILSDQGLFPHRTALPLGTVPAKKQRLALLGCNFLSIFTVFPSSMIDEVGGFDTALTHAEDYELWMRAVLSGWEVVFLKEPYAIVRRTEMSASRDHERMVAAVELIHRRVREKWADSLSDAEKALLERILRHGPAHSHTDKGEVALAEGRGRDAAVAFATAAQLSPGNRRLAQKAALLRFPPMRRVLAVKQSRRLHETGETQVAAGTSPASQSPPRAAASKPIRESAAGQHAGGGQAGGGSGGG